MADSALPAAVSPHKTTRNISMSGTTRSRAATKQVAKPATRTESTQLVKELLHYSIGTILWNRKMLKSDCFEPTDYVATGKERLQLMRLQRGKDAVCDRMLAYLEKGIFDALDRGYLDAVVLGFYQEEPHNELRGSDANDRQKELSESWTFSTTSQNSYSSVKHASEFAPGASVQTVRLSNLDVLKRLDCQAGELEPFDSRKHTFATIKLFYNDACPAEYEPLGFKAPHESHRLVFPSEPDKSVLQTVRSPHHAVSIAFSTLVGASHDEMMAPAQPSSWDAEELPMSSQAPRASLRVQSRHHLESEPFKELSSNAAVMSLSECSAPLHAGIGASEIEQDNGNQSKSTTFTSVEDTKRSLRDSLISPPYPTSTATTQVLSQDDQPSPQWLCDYDETEAVLGAVDEQMEDVDEDCTPPATQRMPHVDTIARNVSDDSFEGRIARKTADVCDCGCRDVTEETMVQCRGCAKKVHLACYGFYVPPVDSFVFTCWACALRESVGQSREHRISPRHFDRWQDDLGKLALKRRALHKLYKRRGWPSGGLADLVGTTKAEALRIQQEMEQERFIRPSHRKGRNAVSLNMAGDLKEQMMREYFCPEGGLEAETHKRWRPVQKVRPEEYEQRTTGSKQDQQGSDKIQPSGNTTCAGSKRRSGAEDDGSAGNEAILARRPSQRLRKHSLSEEDLLVRRCSSLAEAQQVLSSYKAKQGL